MASSNTQQILPMAFHLLPSVLLYHRKSTYTTLPPKTKRYRPLLTSQVISAHSHNLHSRGHSGITATTGTNTVMGCVERSLSRIQKILISICTTLTTVRLDSCEDLFILLIVSLRRHGYHSCRLVSLSFNELYRYPVSFISFVRRIDCTGFYSLFNSTLINGKGRYYGGPNVTLAVVNVKQGLR